MPAGQSNLSTAVNPQTQAALQSLMEREMQMNLADRQANLQLTMQERELDDRYKTREFERKSQLEQMKFQQSQVGQQMMHQEMMQEKQIKAEQEKWDKYNEQQMKLQEEQIKAREKADEKQIKLRLQLQKAAEAATVAMGEGRKKALAERDQIRAQIREHEYAQMLAQEQFATKMGQSGASIRRMIAEKAGQLSSLSERISGVMDQVRPALAVEFGRLGADSSNAQLLDEAETTTGKGIKRVLRGTARAGVKKISDRTGEEKGVSLSDRGLLGPLSGLMADEPIDVNATNPVEAMKRLAPKWAESIAPLLGLDSKSVEKGLNVMTMASYARQGEDIEGAKRMIQQWMENDAKAAQIDPHLWTALMQEIGTISEDSLGKAGEAQIAAEAEDMDNPKAMGRVKANAWRALTSMTATFDDLLEMAGSRADVKYTSEVFKDLGRVIETAEPDELGRILSQKPAYAQALGMDEAEMGKFVNDLGIAEMEQFQRTNKEQTFELNRLLEEADSRVELAEVEGEIGAAQEQQRILEDLIG